MLKSLVGSSPLKDRIISKEDLFERINKELHFRDSAETLEITTDYCNSFEFKITYTDGMTPEVLNPPLSLERKVTTSIWDII